MCVCMHVCAHSLIKQPSASSPAYQEGSVLDHFLSARNPQKNPLLKLDALLAKPIVVGN